MVELGFADSQAHGCTLVEGESTSPAIIAVDTRPYMQSSPQT
jgi:hypothetical protein